MKQVLRYSCHVNINNFGYSDMYSNTEWRYEMFKIGKDNGHGTGFKCNFKLVSLFAETYVDGTH